MKKVLSLSIVILLAFVTGCKKEEIEENIIDEPIQDEELVQELLNLISNTKSNYKKNTTTGLSKSKVLFFNYNQNINAFEEKYDDYIYVENNSTSAFVSTYHYAKYFSDYILYKETEEDDYQRIDYSSYKEIFGVTPIDSFLGYIINEDTILSISQENLKFTISLDLDKSTVDTKIQMKKFGELNDYPTFKKLIMEIDYSIYIDKVIILSNYDISKKGIGELNTNQELMVKFSY